MHQVGLIQPNFDAVAVDSWDSSRGTYLATVSTSGANLGTNSAGAGDAKVAHERIGGEQFFDGTGLPQYEPQ